MHDLKMTDKENYRALENERLENDRQILRGLENAGLENDVQTFSNLLFCTVFEILTLICQKVKTSRDLDHADLGDSLSLQD